VAPEVTRQRGESGRFQMQPSPCIRAGTVGEANHTVLSNICWSSVPPEDDMV
jgi:hypothetical protein